MKTIKEILPSIKINTILIDKEQNRYKVTDIFNYTIQVHTDKGNKYSFNTLDIKQMKLKINTMKQYKESKQPTNDLFIHIYRIAGKLKAEGLNTKNYTKKKAIQLTNNCVSPLFCTKLINNFSNHILIELKTYE